MDGIPPRKKMELKSVGSEDNLNFIKIQNLNHGSDGARFYRIHQIEKIKNDIHIIGTVMQGYSSVLAIAKYNLKNGFEENYFTVTNIYPMYENTISATSYKETKIIISVHTGIVIFDIKTKELTQMNDISGEKERTLIEFNNEIYMFVKNRMFKIDIEKGTQTHIKDFEYEIGNVFVYNDKLWLNTSNGGYSLLTKEGVETQGKFPINGVCICINGKMHLFINRDDVQVKETRHYILGENGWTEKKLLKLQNDITASKGKDTDIGYIQAPTKTEVNDYGETFTIITDKLFLEKQ